MTSPAATFTGITLKLNFGGAEAYLILGDDAGQLRHVTIRSFSKMGTDHEVRLSRLGDEITAAIQDGLPLAVIVGHLAAVPGERRLVVLDVAKGSAFRRIESATSWEHLTAQVLAARYLARDGR